MKTFDKREIALSVLKDYNELKGRSEMNKESSASKKENFFMNVLHKHFTKLSENDSFVMNEKEFISQISAECRLIQPRKEPTFKKTKKNIQSSFSYIKSVLANEKQHVNEEQLRGVSDEWLEDIGYQTSSVFRK